MRKYHRYTAREVNWLKRNVRPGFTWGKIARGFNAKFHTDIGPKTLHAAYMRYVPKGKKPNAARKKPAYRQIMSESQAETINEMIFRRPR